MDEKQLLYKILETFGLSTNERRLFILSLQEGPTAPTKLAKKLGISRPNIYKLMEGLERHGLATRAGGKGYRKKFVVHSPSRVAEKLRKRKTAIEHLDESLSIMLPDLLASYEQEADRSIVKIYEKEQFDETFELMLREAEGEIFFFGSIGDTVYYTSQTAQNNFIKKRIKQGIRARALLLPSKNAKQLQKRDDQELRETRILNVNKFHTTFQVFANKVIIWQPQASIAILIEDQFIAEMFKSIWKMAWSLGEK